MTQPINIFIADDHPIFRCGLREAIEKTDRFKVLGEADHGDEALEAIEKLRPEIAVLDIDMPGLSGLDLAERILEKDLGVKVVILTSYKEESFFNRAMDIGVSGYVLKENAINDLTNGLLAVSRGNTFLSPSISSFLLKRVRHLEGVKAKNTGLDCLTPTELRVLSLVADNRTSKEIAKLLFVSPRTVDTHRNNISGKLELRGSRGLLLFALEHKEELKGFKLFPSDD
ncbi:response regulator transcription factor [Verrucomicrobia bacterium]|jgi:two-component system, NarL family, response regulator DegU|nr:response regulator transcription factor [Verrucomicrobiota bacterium]MDA7510464.1 response regulator transcription factor [Verrucomicrobiota bacterium]MDA7667726.1 response regulator transcription factor [bacterium]MDA7866719.1 response regulator transcription factor [Verrucomicrobiota bacterium]